MTVNYIDRPCQIATLAAAAAVALVAGRAGAQTTKDFVAADANFTDPTAFSPAGVPTGGATGSRVRVNNGGTLRINTAGAAARGIDVGLTIAGTSGSGNVVISDGAGLTLSDSLRFGLAGGTATGTISGGTTTITISGGNNDLTVGDGFAATATLDVSGGTINVPGGGGSNYLVGTAGSTGTVNQAGGVITVGNDLSVGAASAAVGGTTLFGNGTYNLSGGSVAINTLAVSRESGSTGTFTQTGGTVTAGGLLRLASSGGTSNNTTGTYTISSEAGSSELSVAGNVLIGAQAITNATDFTNNQALFVVRGPGSAIDFNGALNADTSSTAFGEGGLTVGDEATLRFEPTADGLRIIDVLNRVRLDEDATIDIDPVGFTPAFGQTFDLIVADAFIDFPAGLLADEDAGAFELSLVEAGNRTILRATAVPEPAALGLFGAAAAGLLARRRAVRR